MNKSVQFVVILALIALSSASSCKNPKINAVTFSNKDATVVTNIAFIAEFSTNCPETINLYAEIKGALVSVPVVEGNKYQVSWVEDAKTASRGERKVNLYDEEGFAAYRKAQRSNEDTSKITPFGVVSVNYSGAYKGPWLKSELIAAIASVAMAYVAIASRRKLIS